MKSHVPFTQVQLLYILLYFFHCVIILSVFFLIIWKQIRDAVPLYS